MFPLIPALILLLLHGPSHFERLAETGRLPAALAAFHREGTSSVAPSEIAKEETSRRVLATLIAATGDRALSEAFAAMFSDADARSAQSANIPRVPTERVGFPCFDTFTTLQDGFLRCVRSRDGPLAAQR